MLNEGAAKLLLVPAGVWVVSDLIPKVVHAGAEAVVFTAAVAGGIVYLGRGTRRAIRGGRVLVARVHRGLDEIETMPQFRHEVVERLDAGDQRFDRMDERYERQEERYERMSKSLELLAETDEHRIKDALAGDARAPVDRRQFPPAA